MAEATAVPQSRARWFVPGDWDGFFALFFSGFPDLLLIAGLAPLCGFSASMVTTRILPGVALSIFVGNIFYAWQAHGPDRRDRDSVWRERSHHIHLRRADHAAGVRAHARREPGVAGGSLRVVS